MNVSDQDIRRVKRIFKNFWYRRSWHKTVPDGLNRGGRYWSLFNNMDRSRRLIYMPDVLVNFPLFYINLSEH